MKKYVWARVLIVCIIVIIGTTMSHGVGDINIVLNDELLECEVKPIIIEGRTLVPIRLILEKLGMTVEWDGENRIVNAKKDGVELVIPINGNVAYKNNEKILLDVPAIIIENRTLVPIRFVAESIDMTVAWDGTSRSVLMYNDSHPIADNSNDVIEKGLRGIRLGMTENEIVKELGEPSRKDYSKYGFTWYIYNDDYSKYVQIGVDKDEVVAMYSNADCWEVLNIGIGSSKESVADGFGKELQLFNLGNKYYPVSNYNGEKGLFFKDNQYVTFFFDKVDNDSVAGVLIANEEQQKTFIINDIEDTGLIAENYEEQIFDLVNSVRVRNGLGALQWNELAAFVAREHSNNMVEYDFFSHTDQDVNSPMDRMKAAQVEYMRMAENIVMGVQTSYDAVNYLMNSPLHRLNIFGEYNYLGVGVDFKETKKLVVTQDFYFQ